MTDDDRRLLTEAVKRRRGLSIRDWQRVNRMLSDPAAWEVAPGPLLILRRRRDGAVRSRRDRDVGVEG